MRKVLLAVLLSAVAVGCGGGGKSDGGTGGGSGGGAGGGAGGGTGGGTGGGAGGGTGGGSGGGGGASENDAGEQFAAATIGFDGGSLANDAGVTLDLPRGAIDSDTEVTVSAAPPPAELQDAGALSPVYSFGPDGTVFAKPVIVRLPLPQGVTQASIYWSQADGGPGFDNIGGTIVNGGIEAEIVHFSEAYVGPPANTRTVSGSQIVTYLAPTIVRNVPRDLSTAAVAALSPLGDGGYDVLPGTGLANGTFEIPNVPNGTYYLRIGNHYVEATGSVVDLGYLQLGRQDKVAATPGTRLRLQASNMAPWTANDSLEFFSPEADYWWFNLETDPAVTGIPDAGDTSVDLSFDLTQNVQQLDNNLIEGNKGDTSTLEQLQQRVSDAGFSYLAVTRIFEPSVTTTQGQTTTVMGSFTDVSSTNTLSTTIKRGNLGSELAKMPAGYSSLFSYFGVVGQSGGLEDGQYGASADFVFRYMAPSGADLVTGGMNYGVPLSGKWGVYAAMGTFGSVGLSLGNGKQPANINTNVASHYDAAAVNGGSTELAIGIPQALQVNGLDASQAQTGVGLTPVLSWSAPAVGTATKYSVFVYRLYDDPALARTQKQVVARMTVTSPRFQLPPGILQAGEKYAFTVSALGYGNNPPSGPLRSPLPSHFAATCSQVISP